jgi:hypothetical protein
MYNPIVSAPHRWLFRTRGTTPDRVDAWGVQPMTGLTPDACRRARAR